MKRFVPKTSVLVCILQLSITILPTEQVKVAIKSHVDDWCIRAKGSRAVTIEQCYWKGEIASRSKVQENEQTFDVHPADIDEQQGIKTQDGKLSIPFLIRLSKIQQSSSSSRTSAAATSCLASISSNLTVERCQLRKSRFRISGTALMKSHSNFCTPKTHQPSIRYKISSSDQACLEFIPTNSSSRSRAAFAFTKCITDKAKALKPTHLWQFCGKNGNCSLSPLDLNWNSLIKVESTGETVTVCKEDQTITSTIMPTVSSLPATKMTTTQFPETATDYKNSSFENNAAELVETSTDYKNSSFESTTNSNGAFHNIANADSGGRIVVYVLSFPLWTNLLLFVGKYIYRL